MGNHQVHTALAKPERKLDFDPASAYPPDTAIFACPGRYVQHHNLLGHLGSFLVGLEGKAFIICSRGGHDRFRASLNVGDFEVKWLFFGGESSQNEIEQLAAEITEPGFVIGLGGGKAIDAAKAVAHLKAMEVIIVPTIASNDSPCSALSILYTDDGAYDRVAFFPANPRFVGVDLSVIAGSPLRYFVAGLGDALATFYEADTVRRARATNCCGGRPTALGAAAAALCRNLLFEAAPQAVRDVRGRKGVTAAVEKATEASILLSGVGFESGGLAGAHGLHNELVSAVPRCHAALHGEKVAFCLMAHLLLEDNAPEAERVARFNLEVGLPVTLAGISVDPEADTAGLRAACVGACTPESLCANMGRKLEPAVVLEAVLEADALGRRCQEAAGIQAK